MAEHALENKVLKGLVPVRQGELTLILEAGYLFMELGKHKEAEEVFLGSICLLPDSEVPHMALGNLQFAMGRFSQALKCHQRAVELNPQSATAHASVAESLFFLHRGDEANKELDHALTLENEGSAHDFAKALREASELGIFS